jgi:DNA repair protein RadD
MQLRPRQRDFVKRCIDALDKDGNTLGVAPTGAGKTVMLSAVAREVGGRTLVLQHRDELVAQNRATFKAVAPGISTDLYTADRKRWSDGVTFGMVQTLSRPDNLVTVPFLDLLVIDEAHHVAANSYKSVIQAARNINPRLKVFGVTATPQRGDRRGLSETFSNVADIISLSELISTGFLVKPRFFVIDCDIRDDLAKVKVTTNDFDMNEVAAIMDKQVVTNRVLDEWTAKAGGRKTVMFCSTVAHAEHVADFFKTTGHKADIIHGEMPDGERRRVLRAFDKGEIQVLVNVAVLTEGWDCQDVSCVVLLRPCSYKSTMIQMIGRGLRKVDPDRYPGVIKSDCIVLDFGYSILAHGSIDTDVCLTPEPGNKKCPECQTKLPAGALECPVCGYEFPIAADVEDDEDEPDVEIDKMKMPLSHFNMTEVHLMDMSPYRWQDLFDGAVVMANGLTAWACLVNYNDKWYVCGRAEGAAARLIYATDDKVTALASADDFLRQAGDKDASRKTKRWLSEPATDKQLQLLDLTGMQFGMTKYLASCLITWKFNERDIKRILLR